MAKDATGYDIEIGELYGYSRNQNGFTTVTIGEAVKVTDIRVTLKVTEVKKASYDDDPESIELPKKNVSVRGIMCFKIKERFLMPTAG